MKSYSYLVNKQFKVNKRRNILTIAGIITSIILFINIGCLNKNMKEVEIERAKQQNGNYEATILDVDIRQIDKIINNVKVQDAGFYKEKSKSIVNVGDVEKTLYITAIDDIVGTKLFNVRLRTQEGRLPKDTTEVALALKTKNELDKNIGDKLTVDNDEYTIVGFYQDDDMMHSRNLYGVTFLDIRNEKDTINVGIISKDIKNIVKDTEEIAKLVGIDPKIENNYLKIRFNSYLLSANDIEYKKYGAGDNSRWITVLAINVAVILLTIIFTYGAINVALKERIHEFSSLRCLGATPNKIRYLLIKESIFLGVLSLIPGIILGEILYWFITDIAFSKIIGLNNYGVTFKIYPGVILTTIVFTVIAITMSTIIPVIKAGKISPIDGLRANTMTKDLIKPKQSKIIKKLFGYKGELAFKNISANNKSFFIITTTLTSLLVIFSTFSGFYVFTTKGVNIAKQSSYDISLVYGSEYISQDEKGVVDVPIEKEMRIKSEIEKLGVVKELFSNVSVSFTGEIKGVKVNPKIKSKDSISAYIMNGDNENSVSVSNGTMLIYDDNLLDKIIPKIETEEGNGKVTIEDFNQGGFILVKAGYGNTKEPIIPKDEKTSLTFKDDNSDTIEGKVLGFIDNRNLIDSHRYGYYNRFTMIVSNSFYSKYKEIIDKNYYGTADINLCLNLLDNVDKGEAITELKQLVSKQGGEHLEEKLGIEELKDNNNALAVLIYTTLILAFIIGAINIINSRIINILLRKKELGTLLAIGIKEKDLKRIIMLEGIIQWFVAGVIGTLLSIILMSIISIIMYFNGGAGIQPIPIWIIVVGLVIMFIINILSSIIPYKKLKNFNTTQLLREVE